MSFLSTENLKLRKIIRSKASCSLDLGDGSERGFYVNQDYILQKLKRCHRGISLMYTYYPNDKTWPVRASIAYPQKVLTGAWDYPYEDYFPYRGGRNADYNAEPFNFMKEIRQHGMDVVLTLTIDPKLTKEDLILIANDLQPFGRVFLRVNHECTGSWFCFTKRATYEEIADFFVLVCDVMHEYAPNVKVILCAGMFEKSTGKLEMEDIFLKAHNSCDIWSGDNYLSLHWGWPVDLATKETSNYACYDVDEVYDKAKATLHRLRKITGQNKPFVLSELNGDGDVTGAYEQANMMQHFMERLEKDDENWLSAFTLYQFRDDGRLGLEVTDPNNKTVGIEQPLLSMYKKELQKPFFMPQIKSIFQKVNFPLELCWRNSEDAEGLELEFEVKKNPHFAELYFEDDLENLNLLIEFEGWNFYKAPGTRCIDLMSYFFENQMKEEKSKIMTLRIFAPPQDGLNHPKDGTSPFKAKTGDWQFNSYVRLNCLPKIRIEYEPVLIV